MSSLKVVKSVVLGISLSTGAVWAQDKLPNGSFAVVNSVPLKNALLEQVIRNNAQQGVKDTGELRRVIVSELVGRAALSQQAEKLGLDKQETNVTQLELLKQNFLAEALIADHLNKNPVDEAAVRKEYERQVAGLKDAKEYTLSDIVVADEALAKSVLARLKKGESFEKLAQEKSIDPTGREGGKMGWILTEQMNPLIANVVVNLGKGALAAAPIQLPNGWHVIRLDDSRTFVPPKYDDSKALIIQGLRIKQRNEFINATIGAARIQVSE